MKKLRLAVIAGIALTIAGASNAQITFSDGTTMNTAVYERTLVVKANGTAIENGWDLVNAVEAIDEPSSANRYLIQLEPGIYDLGSAELNTKPWVDITGAGQFLTTIISSASNDGSTIRISMVDALTLQNLEVVNTGANSSAIAIAGSTVNLWRVHAVHQGMSGDNSVIYSRSVYRRGKSNVTSKLSLDDCRVTNTSINPSGKNVGIEADDATALETTNVVVEVNGSDVSNIGIHLLGATSTALMSMTWANATGSPNGSGLVMATGSLQHSVSAFGSTFEGSVSAVDADYGMAVFADTGFTGPRTDIDSCHFLRCYDLGALAPISDTAAPVAP